MEDILSSIKRIIAEEGEPSGARSRRVARTTNARDDADRDVLELSDAMGGAAKQPAPAAPASMHAINAPEITPEQRHPAKVSTPPPAPVEPIVSSHAAEVSRDALDALSRLVVKPDEVGNDTLEGLVREMLRPMLRDWLDAKLPAIVEAMVAREIDRISNSR